ncbi:COP9 signalosome complex subunit 8-like [Mercenaria mercenaria]|uniref:COP9 signalosome complex subunit 8-like n=1 Tax=Mercenaria mercenaria TaxID=6596 RepID=UPI00234ECDCF|nr:COP9 signalosome complex subunit 8-like [Mercenaria mercenaria]
METEQQITDFEAVAKDLENQELEAPGGVANAVVYGKLLCIYLLQNDTCNAKFLWKRIPQQVKTGSPELAQVWAVGQKMWQRDFPGMYEALQKDWTEPYKDIMTAVLEATRKRAFGLVAQAYSSINAEEFAAYMGMPINDAVKAAQNEGWQADPNTRLVTPKKIAPPSDPVLANEQQLSVLTDYVSFLES